MRTLPLIIRLVLFIGLSANTLNAADNGHHHTERIQYHPFSMGDVRLLPSRFQENFQRDSAWIMSVPVESLTHSFLVSSGAFASKEGGYMTVKKLGGWESLDCDLRGHTTGHLLSALATLYAQTHSDAVRAKADSIVSNLARAQKAYGTSGYLSAYPEGMIDRNIRGESVWAPFYTLHKILQGLIDQYNLCGNTQALEVAKGMGNWAHSKVIGLPEETRSKMLRNEFGGFNEAMYNLYNATGEDKYLQVARFFYHNDKIDPLKSGNLDLGTNHANTFIPKLMGEAAEYELTGSQQSRRAAEDLFYTLAFDHAFLTGEMSDKEHLFPPEDKAKHLTGYDGENCCTFNLLKLADKVFSWNGDVRVADYYEQALYNHILGQQDPQTSMVCYFTPLMTGAHRLYSTPDQSFWCCVGSGFESHVKYASSIYFHNDTDKELYVNLYIPSVLTWDNLKLTQDGDMLQTGKVVFHVDGTDNVEGDFKTGNKTKNNKFTINLRKPSWACNATVKVNGKKQNVNVNEGSHYIPLSRAWQKGDTVELAFEMELRECPLEGDASLCALVYGPVVMAGELSDVDNPFSDPTKYNDYYTYNFQVPEGMAQMASYSDLSDFKKESALNYTGPGNIQLRPFYDMHHKRYAVYWHKK